MLEKFHQKYSREQAQEEAGKIKKKVDTGLARDYPEAEKLYEREELEKAFFAQNDLDFAHGIITRELFDMDEEGKNTVEARIEALPEERIKEAAYFNIAKLYYEHAGNLSKALETAEKIKNSSERTRCLVHLANSVLNNEMDIAKAEGIIQRVTEDPKGYLSYFEKEKERVGTLLSEGKSDGR